MYTFGPTSKLRMEGCHPDIQKILNEAIQIIDFSVLEGHRDEKRQNRFFRSGASKLKWPHSKHNKLPSMAVDVAPYPIIWEGHVARARFYYLQGIIKGIAETLEISIRFGGDWDGDGDITDQSFNDLPHFELWERRAG